MIDIGRWLDEHGLGEYTELFVENKIDFDVLEQITLAELKELEIPLGDRKRILNAVAALSEVELGPAEEGSARAEQPQPRTGDAERRQLTVMFCDLVGSVELGERMDVEDYRDLLARFRNTVVEAVERNGGFVARHQGDGVLVYFGYPQAHENDAEQAVRAGLEIVRTVTALEHPYDATLAARVGVATGLAIVGDSLSTGSSEELAAFGPTPNLAARLQGEAEPNAVIVSETTARLISGLLETKALPASDLKGLAAPVTAFLVLEEERAQSRSEALQAVRLSPLVGRQGELALISRRCEQALEGAGQVVLVSAEPGVGKTRLVHEIRERLRGRIRPITLYCSPYHTGSALHPVIEALGRTLEFVRGDAAEDRFKGLEIWLRGLQLEGDYLTLLSTLLSLPLGEGHEPLTLPPEELKRQTLETLVNLIEALSQAQPVLVVAEDLHWVDPTTLEWLGLLVERVRNAPVLVMLTYRPEFSSPWSGQPHLTYLTLNHLTAGECRQLAASVASERALPEAVLNRIVERTDGVPLFVEELSRTVLEAAEDGFSNESVPETLRDALTARLDRLGPAKTVAQLASVIGRQFRFDWLVAASSLEESAIQRSLERLIESGLVYRRGSSVVGYEFKHALVRDTAYDGLLRDERRRLHAGVASALVDSINQLDAAPDLIAFHYSQAGNMEQAVLYWQRAGDLALQRDSLEEAARHYSQALLYLETGAERSLRVLKVVVPLAQSMHWVGDRQAAHQLLVRYESLPSEIGDALLSARFHSIRGIVEAFFGERRAARRNLEQAVEAAKQTDNVALIAESQAFLAGEESFAEDYRSSAKRAEEALSVLARKKPTMATNVAHWSAGFANFHLGNFEQARRISQQALELGKSTRRTGMLSIGAWILQAVCQESGDFDGALATINDALSLDLTPFEKALLLPELGKASLELGDIEVAVSALEDGLEKARRYRSRQVQVWVELALARAYLERGEFDAAETLTNEALSAACEIGSSRAQARWVAGLLAQRKGENAQAAGYYQASIQELRALGARPHQARVHIATASLAHSSGHLEQVIQHLGEAAKLYREMDLGYRMGIVEDLADRYGVQLA